MWFADSRILDFCHDFTMHQGEENYEVLRKQFMCGYCLHFAYILQSMFPGGEICLCFPYGHVVYVYNKVRYDVEGVSTAEYDMLIPIDFIGDAIKDFKHIRSEVFDSTPEDLVRIKEAWLKTGREVDAPAWPGAWFICRAFGISAPISANYMYYKNLNVSGDFKELLEAAL